MCQQALMGSIWLAKLEGICKIQAYFFYFSSCSDSFIFCFSLYNWRHILNGINSELAVVSGPGLSSLCSLTRSLHLVSSYAELIADWPVVVLGVCTVLIVVCALVGVLVPDLPDFSDPLLVSTDPRCSPVWVNVIDPPATQRDLNTEDVWSAELTRRTKWLQPRSSDMCVLVQREICGYRYVWQT